MAVVVERKFLDDTGSLKSSRQDALASAPLSPPRVTSLKSKKSRLIMSALHRRLWAETDDFDSGGIKNKDCNTPSPNPLPDHKPEETSHTRVPFRRIKHNVQGQNRPVTIQRDVTRSKSILRLFPSKFLARSFSTAPTPSQPLLRSPISAFGSKETRDAALRERGLLPPLKPNMDLSLVERERDFHLPVLTPPQSEEVFAVDEQDRNISAAAKVKQEWEARYKGSRELEQMKSSPYGGVASSSVEKEDTLPGRSTASVDQLTSCSEMSNSSPLAIISALSIKGSQSSAAQALSNNLDDFDYPTPHPHPASSEPYLIPLPPSPSPSPSLSLIHEDPPIMFSTASPSPSPFSGLSSSPVSPIITVTSPIIHASAPPFSSPIELASLHPMTVPHAPSLMMTAPSHATPVTITAPVLLDNHDVILTESPVEATFPGLSSISGCPCNSSDFVASTDISAAGSADLPKARRRFTDPTSGGKTHQVEHRNSSFDLFKRFTAPPPNTASSRRLSMGASFYNMRRSLVGTLSRTKAAGLVVKTDRFDASHLPPPATPSPPAAYSGVRPAAGLKFLQEQQFPASPESKLRVSVSPMLYSRGTIVAEINNIEDEESQRMTELAFLG
ncbi:hypothetical protein E4T56_gene18152 [Termitomyces sp. T112]|nr:hypothetical protein E4T56_gene18152 [Termitomyces sp. T112]KAH0585372.1 hypothetical protein H2248_008609 [Termitomyces sp. 'cryptogamus']